jgi:hypothetical protein
MPSQINNTKQVAAESMMQCMTTPFGLGAIFLDRNSTFV